MFAGLLPGCVLSWSDGAGAEHRFGATFDLETQLPRGTERRSIALGLDVRFGGWEPGVTLGFRSQRTIVPETRIFSDGPALADAVAEQMQAPVPPGGTSTASFLWCTDPESDAAVFLSSWCLGLDISFGGPAVGPSFGLRSIDALVGRALDQDSVLCLVHSPETPDQLSAVLWRFDKEDSR